eukprot:COSAG02_NODE_7851_length_2818_cov_1.966900_1_plen_255_part_00
MHGDFLPPPQIGCPSGWVNKEDMCEECVDGGILDAMKKIGVFFGLPLVLYALYNFASITWRPSGRDGVEAAVFSGACAPEASKAWRDRLAAHLDVAPAEIRADHPDAELLPGDDVLIASDKLAGSQRNTVTKKKTRLSELNGQVGTVLRVHKKQAEVCVHGISGQWKLPVESLTVQPLFADTPQDAPACVEPRALNCNSHHSAFTLVVPACAEFAFVSIRNGQDHQRLLPRFCTSSQRETGWTACLLTPMTSKP